MTDHSSPKPAQTCPPLFPSSRSNLCLKADCNRKVLRSGIACDVCEKWAHPKCSGLDPSAFRTYESTEGLIWVCLPCRKSLSDLLNIPSNSSTDPTLDSPVNTGISNPKLDQLQARVATLESKLLLLTQHVSHVANDGRATHMKVENSLADVDAKLDVAIGRSRNVLVLNIPEPFMGSKKQRVDRDAQHIRSILRAAELPTAKWKRAHRIGKWSDATCNSPRPLLIELFNQGTRDILLSRNPEIMQRLNGSIRLIPDSTRSLPGCDPPEKSQAKDQVVQVIATKLAEPVAHTGSSDTSPRTYPSESTITRHTGPPLIPPVTDAPLAHDYATNSPQSAVSTSQHNTQGNHQISGSENRSP